MRPTIAWLPLALAACQLAGCALLRGEPDTPAAAPAIRADAAGEAPSFDLAIEAPEPLKALLERHLELRRYQAVNDLDDAEIARLLVLAERDVAQLAGTLGFFSPQITIRREPQATRPRIVVAVVPGTPAVVRAVDVQFAGDIATSTVPDAVEQREAIRAGWGLPAGQRFTQGGWDAAKAGALRELTSRHYLAGRMDDSRADIDAPTGNARLAVSLDSGPPYRLGELQVQGVSLYDPVLVPRFSQLQPGQPYDRDALVQAQLRLTGSGYFDSAFLYIDPQSDPAAAPVQVTVRETPLQRLTLGVGMSTDSGPRVSAEHTHNRLPGLGWRTVSKLNVNRKSPMAQTELTSIPDEDLWRWSVLARAERLEEGGLLTHGQRLRVGRFKSWGTYDRNYYLQYDRATALPAGSVPLTEEQKGAGSSITANYLWTGRYFDDPLSPTDGYGLSAEFAGGSTLASDRTLFLRMLAHGLYYRPLATGRLQLRGEAGAVLARDSAHVPATQLFRTGGDTSVRGYGYQEIGVLLPGGSVGPGRYVASGSIEWQRPIRRRGVPTDFESMLFLDAGAVANRPGDLRPRVGVGTGVRWRSPVGPLEVALAYGVQPRRFRLHLNVGVNF